MELVFETGRPISISGMSPSGSGGSVSERLAAAAALALVGRAEERSRLTELLAPDGPAAVFVSGPGGIGKTTLVTGALAAQPLNVVALDARQMEPTVPTRQRQYRSRPPTRSQTRAPTSS